MLLSHLPVESCYLYNDLMFCFGSFKFFNFLLGFLELFPELSVFLCLGLIFCYMANIRR